MSFFDKENRSYVNITFHSSVSFCREKAALAGEVEGRQIAFSPTEGYM